jgi:hypothetical protein
MDASTLREFRHNRWTQEGDIRDAREDFFFSIFKRYRGLRTPQLFF